jgi:hypothetical protein
VTLNGVRKRKGGREVERSMRSESSLGLEEWDFGTGMCRASWRRVGYDTHALWGQRMRPYFVATVLTRSCTR